MNPDEIAVEFLSQGHQFFGRVDVDTNLRNLPQKDIRRMNVNGAGGPLHVGNDLGCNHLFRGAFCVSRENAVHIQIKTRNTPRDRINAQRIDSRINVDNTAHELRIFSQYPV